jgi:hypothetical protein
MSLKIEINKVSRWPLTSHIEWLLKKRFNELIY